MEKVLSITEHVDTPCGVRVQRVQKGRFLGLTGPMGRRVLKFDGAFGPEGCGSGSAAVFLCRLRRQKPKTIQPGLGPVGNAPLLPAASPPAGEICAALTLVLT